MEPCASSAGTGDWAGVPALTRVKSEPMRNVAWLDATGLTFPGAYGPRTGQTVINSPVMEMNRPTSPVPGDHT